MIKNKEIYLAGGCFWGVAEYFRQLDGIESVKVGYANGKTDITNYQLIGQTDHAETVHIIYNSRISLEEILLHYFRLIDPTSINKQGNDFGRQYRTGIYYKDVNDLDVIHAFLTTKQEEFDQKIAVEVAPLSNYVEAEAYHQDYLRKNPNGYCHIDINLVKEPLIDVNKYKKEANNVLKDKLSEIEYAVTQESRTEPAFNNQYWNHNESGIYVDIVTGEPLFSSNDKFDSDCGWPSFSRPIVKEVATYNADHSHNMDRIEVRSRSGASHLGHVFDDGPQENGGLRYCINSAALRFIPKDKMKDEGYGYLYSFVK